MSLMSRAYHTTKHTQRHNNHVSTPLERHDVINTCTLRVNWAVSICIQIKEKIWEYRADIVLFTIQNYVLRIGLYIDYKCMQMRNWLSDIQGCQTEFNNEWLTFY